MRGVTKVRIRLIKIDSRPKTNSSRPKNAFTEQKNARHLNCESEFHRISISTRSQYLLSMRFATVHF